VLLAVGVGLPGAGLAQEAAPATTDTTPDRWDAAIEFGFNGSTGNTRLTVLTTGFRVKHLETDRYELEWSAAFRYGESDDEVIARSFESGLGWDLWPEAAWSPFAFATLERDAFRRIDLRSNAGVGAKRTFVREENAEVSLSAAVLHDYENFTTPTDEDAVADRTNARWSIRARGHRQFENGLRFDHVTFYKPIWDDGTDYNIDSNTKVTILVSDRIGLNLSYTFRRDSTPPPDVERNDQIVQAGLTIQL